MFPKLKRVLYGAAMLGGMACYPTWPSIQISLCSLKKWYLLVKTMNTGRGRFRPSCPSPSTLRDSCQFPTFGGSEANMALYRFVCILLPLLIEIHCKPVNRSRIFDLSSVKHKEFLPPDHIKGLKLERDGHVNKNFHHEAFLGEMVEEGHLAFENMNGYKKLIEIFHKVDKDDDHLVSRAELTVWIHARINEHLEESRKHNQELFKAADMNQDGFVEWKEYLMKIVEKVYGQNLTNTTVDGEFMYTKTRGRDCISCLFRTSYCADSMY